MIVGEQGSERLRIGYVPQRDLVEQIMPFTVRDVVLMGGYRRVGHFRLLSRADRTSVRNALDHVDIADLASLSYNGVSGGQKQRALIARAPAAEPEVLILDEPTNGMDPTSRTAILEPIRKLHESDRLTIIMVSHLLGDVANYVKKIMLVEQNLFQVGTVGEILTESNLSHIYNIPVRVREFLGNKVVIAGGKNV